MNILIFNLHILGGGFLLAVLLFVILFLVKKPYSKERIGNLRTMINAGIWAIVWLMLSGAFLFSDRSQTFLTGILFWVKIGLFILDLIIGYVLVNRKMKEFEQSLPSQNFLAKPLLWWTIFNLVVALVIIVLSVTLPK